MKRKIDVPEQIEKLSVEYQTTKDKFTKVKLDFYINLLESGEEYFTEETERQNVYPNEREYLLEK